MRQPTPLSQLLAWWRAALSDSRLERHEDDPQCGWYRYRAVKNGPWIPVRIYVERDIDPDTGELTGPERIVAEAFALPVDPLKVWTWVHPITKAEYDQILNWRMKNQHEYECAKSIDITQKPTLPRHQGARHA